jgi:hypothetical protein
MGFRYQAWRKIVPEPWLLSQGGVHRQIKGLVLEKVVARGTQPLKRKGFELALASW